MRTLVDAVRAARRGRRSDVKILCDALDGATLLVPAVAGAQPFAAHLIVNHAERRYVPLFTAREPLAAAAARTGWAAPAVMVLDAGAALELARALVAGGGAAGAVIDPFDAHFLELDVEELGHLIARRPIPLERRLEGQPVPPTEPILVTRPASAPPAAMLAALRVLVAAHPRVVSWRIHQTFNPERERRPRLTIALRTADGRGDPALAESVLGAIDGLVPPGERVQVIFDAELGA